MAALWPTTAAAGIPFVFNQLVQDDELNQLVDNLDDLNVRLGTGTGTALATRVTNLETTVNAAGATAAGNAALSTRLGTQITTTNTVTAHLGTGVGVGSSVTTGSATAQLTDLRSRMTAAEGVNTTQTTNIGTINTNLGTWSGGTAISRLQAIEGRANGSWIAPGTTQSVSAGAYGGSSSNDMLLSTAQGTPVGITAATVGTGTVYTIGAGHGGWYHISFQFDIVLPSTGQVNLTIQNSANSISYGTHEAFFPAAGVSWTIGSAHALVFLAAGDTFKGSLGVFLASGIATINNANAGPGTGRTHMRAIRVL